MLRFSAPLLPEDRPRYAMGIGEPRDILDCVGWGYDMFDCVLPTRNGRNGSAFTGRGSVNVRNSAFKSDSGPLDADCPCYSCQHFSVGYLRHLFNVREALGPILLSLHNVAFFGRFMRDIRQAIEAGEFTQFKKRFADEYCQGSQA